MHWLALALVLTLADPPPVRYVNSREIILSFEASASASEPACRARAMVSIDAGASWTPASVQRPSVNTLRYRAPADGRYWLHLVLEDESGGTSGEPAGGTAGHTVVVVDTTEPTFQIHRTAVRDPSPNQPGGAVVLYVTLSDENLGPAPARVYYRLEGEKAWNDGGPADFTAGLLVWSPPEGAQRRVDLRVLVADLAGNRCVERVEGLTLPSGLCEPAPAGAPASAPAPSEDPCNDELRDPAAADAATRPEAPRDAKTSPAPSAEQIAADDEKARRLRELAGRLASQGRYELAAARLEDALKLRPEDAELSAMLGGALASMSRNADARRHFENALRVEPRQIVALEGLARLALEEKRFAEARDRLQVAVPLSDAPLRLRLRLGDAEYQLGRVDAALGHWRAVAAHAAATPEERGSAQKRITRFQP
jgi:Tetratricopeptide repeat